MPGGGGVGSRGFRRTEDLFFENGGLLHGQFLSKLSRERKRRNIVDNLNDNRPTYCRYESVRWDGIGP